MTKGLKNVSTNLLNLLGLFLFDGIYLIGHLLDLPLIDGLILPHLRLALLPLGHFGGHVVQLGPHEAEEAGGQVLLEEGDGHKSDEYQRGDGVLIEIGLGSPNFWLEVQLDENGSPICHKGGRWQLVRVGFVRESGLQFHHVALAVQGNAREEDSDARIELGFGVHRSANSLGEHWRVRVALAVHHNSQGFVVII